MPFKSQAQRRKFYQMYRDGEISKETLDEWESSTPKGEKLPERLSKEAGSAQKALLAHSLLRPGAWLPAGVVGGAAAGVVGANRGASPGTLAAGIALPIAVGGVAELVTALIRKRLAGKKRKKKTTDRNADVKTAGERANFVDHYTRKGLEKRKVRQQEEALMKRLGQKVACRKLAHVLFKRATDLNAVQDALSSVLHHMEDAEEVDDPRYTEEAIGDAAEAAEDGLEELPPELAQKTLDAHEESEDKEPEKPEKPSKAVVDEMEEKTAGVLARACAASTRATDG